MLLVELITLQPPFSDCAPIQVANKIISGEKPIIDRTVTQQLGMVDTRIVRQPKCPYLSR